MYNQKSLLWSFKVGRVAFEDYFELREEGGRGLTIGEGVEFSALPDIFCTIFAFEVEMRCFFE